MQRRLISRLLSAILLVALSVGVVAPRALAQPERTVYLKVDYMKVPPGSEEEYVTIEQNIWKPVHEERMRRGLLTNWSLYDVSYTTPDAPYNYVTINVFEDFERLEMTPSEEIFAAAHPEGDYDAMMERTMAARDIVHAEVWQLVDTAVSTTETGPPGRYLVVNFMDAPAGAGEEYLAAERDIWKPIHQNRIDAGEMSGWGIYSLVLPRGEAMHYNFGTVDFFNEPNDVVGTIDDATIRASHPDVSETGIEAMMTRTNEARSIYKSELWTLVDTAAGLEE